MVEFGLGCSEGGGGSPILRLPEASLSPQAERSITDAEASRARQGMRNRGVFIFIKQQVRVSEWFVYPVAADGGKGKGGLRAGVLPAVPVTEVRVCAVQGV